MKSVIICDMEGIILKMNKGAADMFGYNPNELIGNKGYLFFLRRNCTSECTGLAWKSK